MCMGMWMTKWEGEKWGGENACGFRIICQLKRSEQNKWFADTFRIPIFE